MLPDQLSELEPDYLRKTYLCYGKPKIGKTTTIANLGDAKENKVLFFTTEQGHKFQKVYKWQKLDKDGRKSDPYIWAHFKECVRELATEKHQFKSLAIDTVDNLFSWCAAAVCLEHDISHESDLGFGKGYSFIKKEFLAPLNLISQKGMGLIFLSHETTKELELGNRKITYTDTTLPGTASKIITGLCDYILYFHSDLSGNRLIRTKGTETVNAGDRSGMLPELIEMNADKLKTLLQEKK